MYFISLSDSLTVSSHPFSIPFWSSLYPFFLLFLSISFSLFLSLLLYWHAPTRTWSSIGQKMWLACQRGNRTSPLLVLPSFPLSQLPHQSSSLPVFWIIFFSSSFYFLVSSHLFLIILSFLYSIFFSFPTLLSPSLYPFSLIEFLLAYAMELEWHCVSELHSMCMDSFSFSFFLDYKHVFSSSSGRVIVSSFFSLSSSDYLILSVILLIFLFIALSSLFSPFVFLWLSRSVYYTFWLPHHIFQ